MLEILVIWLLFALVSVFWGQKLCGFISTKWIPEFEPNIWIFFWVGLSLLSFSLGLVSFISPFGPGVKLLLWILILLPVILSFTWIKRFFTDISSGIKRLGIFGNLLVLFGALITILKSSGHPEIFDEGAYHLPLIRMWEQQGLVPGIANLNGHYGLNSSWHILSAFSNLDFLPGWKLAIALNGLLAVVLSLYASFSLAKILNSKALVTDWIVLFLPFFVFRNLLSSPSTDIPAIFCTWFIFTIWLKNIENQDSPWRIWPILGILPFWVVMIKASSAALLFVPIGLVVLAYKEKVPNRIWIIFSAGAGLILPWVLQNWFLTGYCIFPIKSTAFFHPEWQVPIGSIDQKFYLKQFGAFAPPEHFTLSWLNFWFKAHNRDTQVILLLVISSLVSVLVALFRRNEQRVWVKVYLFFTVFACLLTWFVTITEPRYGFGALVFSALLPIGVILIYISRQYPLVRFLALSILVLQLFNIRKTLTESGFSSDQIITPTARPSVKYQSIRCGNFSGFSPIQYLSQVPENKPVFCWNCPFPCVPKEGLSDSASIFQIQILGRNGYSFRKFNQ